MLLLVLILVLYMFPQFPLVDVLVDRVCALIEGSLEEQGAHCDGEGKGGSSAEQQGVQARRDRRRRPTQIVPPLKFRNPHPTNQNYLSFLFF